MRPAGARPAERLQCRWTPVNLPPGSSTSNPIALTEGTPYNGNIIALGILIFQVTAVSSPPTGNLTALGSDFTWGICPGGNCSFASLAPLCDNNVGSPGDEICPMTGITGGQSPFIRIDEWGNVAGSFTFMAN